VSPEYQVELSVTKDISKAIVGLRSCGVSCGPHSGGYTERAGFWISLPTHVSARTDRHEFGHILGLGHQKSGPSIMEFHGGSGVVQPEDFNRVGPHYLDEELRWQKYLGQ
jgi:hypothetical protein